MKHPYQPKPLFTERMKELLKDNYPAYEEALKKSPTKSIRCNTLKISPSELKTKLEALGWEISQPYKDYPEIMTIQNQLQPGELGKSIEHTLGYFYVQEISSMMPIVALQPQPDESFFDCCASPGSKTGYAAAMMENQGTIIANDVSMGRISILASNLGKIGASNTIITRHDAVQLAGKLKNQNIKFDKILADVPCSGEGNVRSNPKTYLMWNINMIKKISRLQRKIASSVLELLKVGGEMIYSTCTHSPEENEENIQYLLDNFNISIEPINLPIKTHQGITEWKDKTFSPELKKAVRIYPQDENIEGFFLCKIKKLGGINHE